VKERPGEAQPGLSRRAIDASAAGKNSENRVFHHQMATPTGYDPSLFQMLMKQIRYLADQWNFAADQRNFSADQWNFFADQRI
jgi:hypothetical protein